MTMMGTEKPSLDELSHFGVKGMKWGVRRGGLKSRLVGTLDDANQREIASLTRARENRGATITEKAGRLIGVGLAGGTKRYNNRVDKNLLILKKQRERIKAGKLKTRDILSIVSTVGIADLLVSVRDNRG